MSNLEDIKKIIKNFIYESQQIEEQITEIENKRIQLAEEKKKATIDGDISNANEFRNSIIELGNKSQELQNKLYYRFNEVKKIVNITIDNLITDRIRKIRKMDEEKQELEKQILSQTGTNVEYEARIQEFFERFGRVPELSEKAQKKEEIQDNKITSYKNEIKNIEDSIINMETELTVLATIKRDVKNRNWSNFIENKNCKEKVETVEQIEEEAIELPLIEEFRIEEIEQIENINIEQFKPIEKAEIGEIEIEEFKNELEIKEDNIIQKHEEQETEDEIERLARAIVEEIIAEQSKDLNIGKVENEVIFNKIEENKIIKNKEKAKLLNIIAKIEDGEIVYKAQISNEEEMVAYPTLEMKNILLNDKEYREEIEMILEDYSDKENKTFDETVIKKIDPTICEILERFAKKYDYNSENLIYNYAMSFSTKTDSDVNFTTPITYNLAYLKYTNLSNKEKKVISKICKKSAENENVDIIGGITGFGKIKYIFRRIFNLNNMDALTDGKYQ